MVSLLLLSLYAQDTAAMFERDIRPVLARNCQGCHNEKNRSSGLALVSRESIEEGGNRGPGMTWIRKAIRHEDGLKMPPSGKLPAAEIAKLEAWLDAGAPWPKAVAPSNARKLDHWAFRVPQRPAAPTVRDAKWPKTEIDHFVLAKLEQAALKPSPEAAKTTLLRRVALDLTGLLPTPGEVDAFVGDASPDAYEKQVDRLLASPHYGERWARHWLDQARYADSDGGSRDEPRHIWKYREWVINAINRDMPFDQFVVEQLAGDLVPNATVEQRIATGFHRNSLLQIEAGTDREQYRVEAVADRVDATGTVFLGLSTGCARCHDHKYDPLTQKEYYQLFALFNNVDEYGPDRPPLAASDLDTAHAPLLPLGSKEDIAKWETLRAQLLALYKERFAYRGGELNEAPRNDLGEKIRTETINNLRKQIPSLTLAMVMNEMPEPRPAHVLLGGDYLRKGVRVEAGVPAWLHQPKQAIRNRLDMARWLVDERNPLLARVAVNRIWQRYFGIGLVETENDFGTQGSAPTHPELLDWLATEYMSNGWSAKKLHRRIVLSSVYRQASAARPDAAAKDPRNLLLARQNRLRMEAEIVRDSALVASGLLNAKVGGPSVYPPQPEGVMETGQVKQQWRTSTGADRYRRGLYTFHYRITPNPSMKVFDAANGLAPATRRARTNNPLQALTLLNDPNFHDMARALGKRMTASNDPIATGITSTVSRAASAQERDRIMRLYRAELDAFQTEPNEVFAMAGKDATPELAAWTAIARVLLNTDEFITRE